MDRDKIEQAVKISNSFREVSKHLGITYHGHINKTIKKLGIDTSHFRFGNEYQFMIGRKYGKLTILSLGETISGGNRSKNKKRKRRSCKCLCDCGKEVTKVAESIKDGLIKSCGCAYIDNGNAFSGKNNPAWTGIGDFPSVKFNRIKLSAQKRDLEFSVSKEYLWELFEKQNRKCALSGIELKFGKANKWRCTTASLDRVDNKIGYIEGNVQWIHKDINIMKNNHDQEYFIELCTKITNYKRTK